MAWSLLLPGFLAAMCVTTSGGSETTAPTIQITALPAYGTNGLMQGVVTGVNFATHRVAAYIYIEGLGWWIKPDFGNPTVAINPNGTFSVSVTTGGTDPRAGTFKGVISPHLTQPTRVTCQISVSCFPVL